MNDREILKATLELLVMLSKIGALADKKNDAVRVQNFEMASKYHSEEKDLRARLAALPKPEALLRELEAGGKQ